MRVELIKCEVCDATHVAEYKLPHAWIVIRQASQEQDFCSVECLKKHLGIGEPTHLLSDASQSKMRRFILVDGETADETEGVKWSDGRVTLESRGCSLERWEDFKSANPGCGVTWIDQEIKEEEMSHAAN
jgi:hypothetical protein